MFRPSKETEAAHDAFMELYAKDLKRLEGKCFYQKQVEDFDEDEGPEDKEGYMLIESVDDDGVMTGLIVGFQGQHPVLMAGEIHEVDGEPCSKKEFLAALDRVQRLLSKKITALTEG